MANLDGTIDLHAQQHDRPITSHTDYAWTGGGQVLTITTVLPDRGLATQLTSVYVAGGNDTIATHSFAMTRRTAEVVSERHDHAQHTLHPVHAPRGCVYDHAHQLIEQLADEGVTIQLADGSFTALERIGS